LPTIITLLSDFGSGSPYPAEMKAVLAGQCEAVLIDITHDVPRHDVRTGAYLLAAVARSTPAGTVHLAVVDPGVGTARRPVVVISGGQSFVGPDNGLLLPAARRVGRPRVYEITAPDIVQASGSSTFHGRDIFAPAVARLARGTPPDALGRPVDRFVDLDLGVGRRTRGALTGTVIYVDAFGNLVTNIPAAALMPDGRPVGVTVGRRRLRAVAARTYGDVPSGRVAVVPNSDGLLEVAVREGSAAARLAAARGSTVTITLRP